MNNSILELRSAKREDAKAVWLIANDALVRSMSFLSDPIPWDEHLKWYNDQLSNNGAVIYVLVADDERIVGNVRFAVERNIARISIALAPSSRGNGTGTKVIRMGCKKLFGTHSVEVIEALIRPSNQASVNAFVRAGFQKGSETVAHGEKALISVLDRITTKEKIGND
ncbi:MAG: GNAT family N-acetyltransferase [Flavobacteriales bacterium]|nr:GNAT family N-acetyltransferase [Flavobacteriales bacterium]